MAEKAVPIIAAKSPAKVELEAGKTYLWCRCGRSENQPFCDGSHAGTGITPKSFTADKDGASDFEGLLEGSSESDGSAESDEPVHR